MYTSLDRNKTIDLIKQLVSKNKLESNTKDLNLQTYLETRSDSELEKLYSRFLKLSNVIAKSAMAGLKVEINLEKGYERIGTNKDEIYFRLNNLMYEGSLNYHFDCGLIDNGDMVLNDVFFDYSDVSINIDNLNFKLQSLNIITAICSCLSVNNRAVVFSPNKENEIIRRIADTLIFVYEGDYFNNVTIEEKTDNILDIIINLHTLLTIYDKSIFPSTKAKDTDHILLISMKSTISNIAQDIPFNYLTIDCINQTHLDKMIDGFKKMFKCDNTTPFNEYKKKLVKLSTELNYCNSSVQAELKKNPVRLG